MLSIALSPARGVQLSVLTLAFMALPAWAATPGFIEDFNSSPSTFNFGAPSTLESSGGVGGVGDGYLHLMTFFPSNLGTATSAAEFTGNLTADGVTGFSFWLNDVGTDEELEIHVGVGTAFLNTWMYVPGFIPPNNGWAQFSVDFTTPTDWVQIHGSGTFADALANSDRLVFRHDVAPVTSNPEPMQGDFGLDRVTVLPEPATMVLLLAGGLLAVRRRAV